MQTEGYPCKLQNFFHCGLIVGLLEASVVNHFQYFSQLQFQLASAFLSVKCVFKCGLPHTLAVNFGFFETDTFPWLQSRVQKQ